MPDAEREKLKSSECELLHVVTFRASNKEEAEFFPVEFECVVHVPTTGGIMGAFPSYFMAHCLVDLKFAPRYGLLCTVLQTFVMEDQAKNLPLKL